MTPIMCCITAKISTCLLATKKDKELFVFFFIIELTSKVHLPFIALIAPATTDIALLIQETYTKSLVNTNSFYTNFTNTHFQNIPIPHLTRTMKQKFLH